MRAGLDPTIKRLALADFLSEIDAEPWAWGEWDCTMMIAQWIERLTGENPAKAITYRSEAEALRLVTAHGGFTAWAIRTLDAFGLRRVIDGGYEAGDVAIIDAPRLQIPIVAGVMAIFQNGLWVVKTPRGLIGQRFRPIAAWRL